MILSLLLNPNFDTLTESLCKSIRSRKSEDFRVLHLFSTAQIKSEAVPFLKSSDERSALAGVTQGQPFLLCQTARTLDELSSPITENRSGDLI